MLLANSENLTPQLLTFAPASHLSLTLPYKGREKEKLFYRWKGESGSPSPNLQLSDRYANH
jgi:hypothetical protein